MSSKIRVGSLVKNSKAKSVGIVIKVVGNVDNPKVLIVKTDGQIKKWTLRQDKEVILQKNSESLLRRFFFRVTLALKDLLRILSSVCK
jgi:rRNA processing protein Gar1